MSSLLKALLLAGCVATLSVPINARAQTNRGCDDAITEVFKAVSELKAGDKRADVERSFTLDGGLSSMTISRYVFKKYPYIKIDVEFSAESKFAELSPTDVVVHVSKPYLEYPYAD
jgi:hypothetical protein